MKTKQFFLISFIFIILATVVYAPPPVQQSVINTVGLDITHPEFEAFIVDEELKLHFHVYNSSGIIQNNATIDCTLHLYKPNGGHLYKENMTFDGVEWEFELTAAQNNLTGHYQYNVWCEDSSNEHGGFISTGYHVTTSGQPQEYQGNNLLAIIFFLATILIIFALIMLLTHEIWFKIIAFGMILGFILLGTNLVKLEAEANNFGTNTIQMLTTTYTSMIWVTWLLFAVGFLIGIIWLFKMIINIKDGKRNDPPGGEFNG